MERFACGWSGRKAYPNPLWIKHEIIVLYCAIKCIISPCEILIIQEYTTYNEILDGFIIDQWLHDQYIFIYTYCMNL